MPMDETLRDSARAGAQVADAAADAGVCALDDEPVPPPVAADAAPDAAADQLDADGLLDAHHDFIYRFPVRTMGAPEDECADFYVYAIDQIRRRKILTGEKYVKREGTRFVTWLAVVLRNLYIDMKRAERAVRVELSDTLDATAAADCETPGESLFAGDDISIIEEALGLLRPESQLLFKLLLPFDLMLTDADMAMLRERSGLGPVELQDRLCELEGCVRDRAVRQQERHEELSRVFWWVRHYAGRLANLLETYGDNESAWSAKVARQIDEVRRKLGKRRRQHAELVRAYRAAGVTVRAPYDLIAPLLGTTRDAVKMEAFRARRAVIDAWTAAQEAADAH
jgi:DNA-directed RNA polymerase specialized sigma24 family protein